MIKIDEIYYITADANNYILVEKKIKQEDNTDYFTNLGYYTSISGALKGLLKIKMRKYVSKETEITLKNAINEFERIEKEIISIKESF